MYTLLACGRASSAAATSAWSCSNYFVVNEMRVQLICFAVWEILCICCATEAAVQPAAAASVHVLVDRGEDFVQWLAKILLPTAAQAEPVTTQTTQVDPLERECTACRCGLIYTLDSQHSARASCRHHYPWLAMVLLAGDFHCAGSLISDVYVLTAGHCVEGMPTELIQVHLLEPNRSAIDAQVLERRATHVTVHELYKPYSFDHDIALIRLDRPVSFEQRLRPVCLSSASASYEGELAKLTSWSGPRQSAAFGMQSLQEVDVLILSQSECRRTSSTDNLLCASCPEDACSVDSGGSLHVLFDELLGQYKLLGLVSKAPGLYTPVNQYLRWIEANTANACYCMDLAGEDY
ncbi:PREDICTED: ovochymase-1 [Drosophila arizonae]|uniref:Ovochymase-1 n=1 Tax=Drosophila arizonae TaxID=7263 RepID=A0ABM1PBU0_DROAR|nr:PREDICTED: ovochymase-1 [Drosophila arizonae]